MELKITHVELPDHLEGEGGYTDSYGSWDNSTLYDASKDLDVFDLPLLAIDLSNKPWGMENFKWMLYHVKRIESADLSYPVIMNPDGYIIDGWHRVAKAILNKELSIKAVRLRVMPDPDSFTKE